MAIVSMKDMLAEADCRSKIQQAILLGTTKINVNTDNQIAFTSVIRGFLREHSNAYDPRDYLKPARKAIKEAVKKKIRLFGSSGRA